MELEYFHRNNQYDNTQRDDFGSADDSLINREKTPEFSSSESTIGDIQTHNFFANLFILNMTVFQGSLRIWDGA